MILAKTTAKGVVAASLISIAIICAAAKEPKRLTAAQLLSKFDQYVGQRVIMTGGRVQGEITARPDHTDFNIVAAKTGKIVFVLSDDDIILGDLWMFLKFCSLPAPPSHKCEVPLLATPTHDRVWGVPVLKSVKTVR